MVSHFIYRTCQNYVLHFDDFSTVFAQLMATKTIEKLKQRADLSASLYWKFQVFEMFQVLS